MFLSNPSHLPLWPLSLSLNQKEWIIADPQFNRILLALMNQAAVNGGAAAHWGGPAAFADILSVLWGLIYAEANPWYEKFCVINDIGHGENGTYALRANYQFEGYSIQDLQGFRSLDSHLTGHGEAHLNPEGVFLSNGPLGSSLSMSLGLAMADKQLQKQRLTFVCLSDGACMEGEAKEIFSAAPGFMKQGKLAPFVLLISDNGIKLSGPIAEQSYSMGPFFDSLETLGWEVERVDGHNLQAIGLSLLKCFQERENVWTSPKAIIFKTKKGKGVKEWENTKTGAHGYPLKAFDPKLKSVIEELVLDRKFFLPKEVQNWLEDLIKVKPKATSSSTSSAPKKEKIQKGVSKALIELKNKGIPVVSISADLAGSTGMQEFRQAFPESSFDVGIAESAMIGVCAGFSKRGFLPVADTFAQFGVTKGALPLLMANLSGAPLVGIFSHTGFQDAADGASHQSTHFFSALKGIVQVDLLAASCSEVAYELLMSHLQNFKWGLKGKSKILFLGREEFPSYLQGELLKDASGLPLGRILKRGDEGVLVTWGPLVEEALETAFFLEEQKGIALSVVDVYALNSLDLFSHIVELVRECSQRLYILEDHQKMGGLGESLLSFISEEVKCSLRDSALFAIPGVWGQSAYVAKDLYRKYGLNKESLVNVLENRYNRVK